MRNEGRHKFFKEPFVPSEVLEVGAATVKIEDTDFKEIISLYFGSSNIEITVLDETIQNSKSLKRNDYILLNNDCDGPIFARIQLLFNYNGKIYIACCKIEANYESHYRAYKIGNQLESIISSEPTADAYSQESVTVLFPIETNSTDSSQNSTTQVPMTATKRARKRKIFFDEDDEMT
ncbi:unnamed protein product, partial [Allacma fusca]